MHTRAVVSFASLSLLIGCGDPTPADDAGRSFDAASSNDTGSSEGVDAASSTLDALTSTNPDAFSTIDARPSTEGMVCLFHTQCDEGQRCLDGGIGSSDRCGASSVPRGPNAFEDECANNDECSSGFCYSTGYPGVDRRCSKQCETTADCGEIMNTCVQYNDTGIFYCTHRTSP